VDDRAVGDQQCEGITKAGLRCRRPGNPYCHHHRPPSDSLNFEARREPGPGDDQDQDSLFDDTDAVLGSAP